MAPAGQLVFHLCYTLQYLVRNATEVAAVHCGVNIDHGLHVVVRNLRLSCGACGAHQISEDLWWNARRSASHWGVLQRLITVYAILRRLHGDVITNTIFWIQPECRGRLKAGTQG